MTCPRCGNEWDVSKSPCSRCGLLVRLPGRSSAATRTSAPAQKSQPRSGSLPPTKSQTNDITPAPFLGAGSPFSQLSSPPPTPIIPPSSGGVNVAGVTPPPTPNGWSSIDNFAARSLAEKTGRTTTNFPNLDQGFDFDSASGENAQKDPFMKQTRMREGGLESGVEQKLNRSVPNRPSMVPLNPRPTSDQAPTELHRQQSMLRPSRLVTNSPVKEGQSPQSGPLQPPPSSSSLSSPNLNLTSSPAKETREARMLIPGTVLRNGRYRLREIQGRQEWLSGVHEVMWAAQDAQRGGSQVMICELVVPESGSMVMQSTLRTATMALTSVGRHPHIPTLWDAFADQGRNFFVFEPIEGESLLARMRRTGRGLPEQDIIECCLQMTEVLELLAQQSPPLTHGLIRPEHILIGRSGGQYILTNFSIVLAGGATQFIVGIDRPRLSPYAAPEFSRGVIDVRSDLYSLVATAYHAVTGSVPTPGSGNYIPSAQRLNPTVSAQFDAILARGLRPVSSQRYQRPSELRQELLAMRSVNGSILPRSANSLPGQPFEQPLQANSATSAPSAAGPSAQSVADSVSQMLPNMLATDFDDLDQDRKMLLPRPEELPPMAKRNDLQVSIIWLAGILVCLIVLVFLSRGFM